jgi:hypothetical protein
MSTLRKLVGKELGETISSNDYDFHVSAVSECHFRRPLSERIQRELETRYAASIRRLSKLKSKEELATVWAEATTSGLVAETSWAALTQPRCNEDLRQKICRDVHIFQHQAGAAARADLNRLTKLKEENAALLTQLSHYPGPAWHLPPNRQAMHPARQPSGHNALGRRAHFRLAASVPPFASAL